MQPLVTPVMTTALTEELERRMAADYAIDPRQTLEHAGVNLAEAARRMQDGSLAGRAVVVLAGRGKNGACGLIAARHLVNWGAEVQIICSHAPGDYRPPARQPLHTLQAMAAALAWAEEGWELPPCDLVIDAIIGIGLRGELRGNARNLIALANSSPAPILSLDAPSGLDTERGIPHSPCVQASATLALGLPQQGLLTPAAQAVCGVLYLADVGIPADLVTELGLGDYPPLFAQQPIIRLSAMDGKTFIANQEE